MKRFTVDRIENGRAVLECENGDFVSLDVKSLPKNIKDGDILNFEGGSSFRIATGVRWVCDKKEDRDKVLLVMPRSGLGFRYGIRLTESGLALADKMIERNRVIRELLVRAGVDPAIAEADACEIEHAVSDQSLSALKNIGIILRSAGKK